MGEQNTHINYTAADIERYLKGNMSAKEMHDMEKAALQDPFLADAIEGYSEASFTESHKHLNEITAALQGQKQETKVVPLPTKSFYWWKVAAMIVLVAGVGVSSWYLINSNNSTKEAKNFTVVKENKAINQDTTTKQSLAQSGNIDTTSSTLFAQNLPKETLKTKNTREKVTPKHMKIPSTNYSVNEQKIDTIKVNPDSTMQDVVVATSRMSEKTLNSSVTIEKMNSTPISDTVHFNFKTQRSLTAKDKGLLNTFKGRVLDNNNQPVPFATIATANDEATTTDPNGYFKLQVPDTTVNVTVSSVGFISTNAQLKSYSANNILVQTEPNALNDVAEIGYGTKKLAKKPHADSAYPAGGWESFQAYVYKKLNKPLDTTSNPIVSGDVELEFLIDAYGNPYNFSVLKSSNDASASKAIEIIKDGPKWISGKNKKGKVTIQF